MSTPYNNLHQYKSTGFTYFRNPVSGENSYFPCFEKPAVSIIIFIEFATGQYVSSASSRIISPYEDKGSLESIKSQMNREAEISKCRVDTIPQFEDVSVKTQLDSLRKKMGLNISEIAAMLLVSRPTIYEWLEAEENLKLRRGNQTRLNNIYDFCLYWERKNLGQLGIYLYKKIGDQHDSLFGLLLKKALNKEQIRFTLDRVGAVIAETQKQRVAHDALLKKYGFKEISEEERRDRFERSVFTIG